MGLGEIVLDLQKQLIDNKIAEAKAAAKPEDAQPFIDFLFSYAHLMTEADKKELQAAIDRAHQHLGNILIDRALADGTITEADWILWQSWGISPADIAALMQAHYAMRDGGLEQYDRVAVLTMPEEPHFKYRHVFEQKFNVKLITDMEDLLMP